MASIKETYIENGLDWSIKNTRLEIAETKGEALYLQRSDDPEQRDRAEWAVNIIDKLKRELMGIEEYAKEEDWDLDQVSEAFGSMQIPYAENSRR